MAKSYDVVIKGGVVVGAFGMKKADVGILGEKIISVEPGLNSEDAGPRDRCLREVYPAGGH